MVLMAHLRETVFSKATRFLQNDVQGKFDGFWSVEGLISQIGHPERPVEDLKN